MPEEIKDVQEPEVSESPEDQVDFESLAKEREAEIETLKKMNQGQDKKVTELFSKISSLEKVISEKDNSKKTVEEQLQEMQQQLSERDKREKAKEKEALVHKVIAENKLDPEFDFDFLHKFETVEAIQENAQKRVEYYKKIKEDGFKERAGGSTPTKGVNSDQDLSVMSMDDLNKLAIEKPELKAAITEAIVKKYRSK